MWIHDEDSKNGTYVNGQRITRARLRDGDLIRIGDSLLLFRFVVDEAPDADVGELIGQAPVMGALRAEIARSAKTQLSVLLLGESGTGKDVAARAIHRLAGLGGSPVTLNCAAVPEHLAESQLFGHVAGAFSGARGAHEGLFRAADGGTLFLDEIGELALDLQAKLLRALEDGTVTPVGTNRPVACSARIVAATNRDLARAVEQGQFRADLLARLMVLPVRLPPLRARREDILRLLAHSWGGPLAPMTARLAEALLLHPWPLNVRELINLGHYLKVHSPAGRPMDLLLVLDRLKSPASADGEGTLLVPAVSSASTSCALLDSFAPPVPLRPAPKSPPIPREVLERMLTEHDGVVARVAAAVGRSRRQVRRWMERYQLNPKQDLYPR